MKHLLFLDIDGVLANDETYGKRVATKWGDMYPFDDENVKLFNKLCHDFEIQYVISSTWRKFYSLDELCEIFRWNGITQMPIGITRHLPKERLSEDDGWTRVREIRNNLNDHEVTGVWFALDDMNLRDLNTKTEKHFILSDPIDGMKGDGVYDRIVELLNSKNDDSNS
jgi:hypothetical protein